MEKSEPIDVKCFGVPEENIRNLNSTSVEIQHPETGVWRRNKILHANQDCPVCGTPMHVRAIVGTCWIACCSQKCYDELEEKRKELGGLSEAFEYFRERRKRNKRKVA